MSQINIIVLIGNQMKRIGYLYEKVISEDNIKNAILEAYKNKKVKTRYKYKKYIDNIDFYVQELINNFHINGEYEIKNRIDSNSGKIRELQIPKFYPDQIIQHALTQITLPYIMKKITRECSCSIKKRGTLYASKLIRKALKKKSIKYYAQFDIIKYFPSIDRDILLCQLKNIFKDSKIIDCYHEIIYSVSNGIPIGNYTSQHLSNLYLSPLDRYIKQELHIEYYSRYADDFVILSSNKRKLEKAIPLIVNFLYDKLKLKVHDNIIVKNVYESPIDFAGYKHYKKYTIIRKRNWKKTRRMLIRKNTKKRARRLISYYGYIKNSNSRYILKRYIEKIKYAKTLLKKENKNGDISTSSYIF